MRTCIVNLLADGLQNALTNFNGGSTHLNVRDWQFWRGRLDAEELQALYDAIAKGLMEYYKEHGAEVKFDKNFNLE